MPKTTGQKSWEILQGDARKVLAEMAAESVHAVVTDPPYALAPDMDVRRMMTHWLQDGEYMPAAGGYMGKKWDAAVPGPKLWAEVLRVLKPGRFALAFAAPRTQHLMGMALDLAGFEVRDVFHWLYATGYPAGCKKLAGGWANRLKTSHEPILLCRKPLAERTLDEQHAKTGTGGLNIDACRVARDDADPTWPPNTLISSDVARELGRKARAFPVFPSTVVSDKPSRAEKEAGLEGLRPMAQDVTRKAGLAGGDNPSNRGAVERLNSHATVKPIELMQWLCRLVAPQEGIVLDPFCGSGTTGIAAILEGFGFIGVELDPRHAKEAGLRIADWERRAAGVPALLPLPIPAVFAEPGGLAAPPAVRGRPRRKVA